MAAEAPALIILSKAFLVAAENSTSALTYVIFLLVRPRPIFLPGKIPTWILCCQRGLGGKSSVSLGPTSSTLCLWIAIVNTIEQASACPTLHLVQLRVLAGLMFLHSLCLRTTTCLYSRHLFWLRPFWNAFSSKIFTVHLLSLSWTWGLDASGGRCCSRLLSIKFFWEEKAKMAFCCSPLKSVSIGPPGNFNGIYEPSAVFAKAHLISSLVYASVEVRPVLQPLSKTEICTGAAAFSGFGCFVVP